MRLTERLNIALEYLWHGRSRYLIHSPFVFAFVNEILRDQRHFYAYDAIHELRERLQKDDRTLALTELGANAHTGTKSTKRVSQLVNATAIDPKYGHVLFRIANHYKPAIIVEVGTGLGISTAYLAEACHDAKIITLEGNAATANVAKENFAALGLNNIETVTGNFDDTLAPALAQLKRIDLAFIDGNHQSEATLRYFRQCLPYIHNDSILIFDDINWSADMHQAWNEITKHPRVKLSLGLYRLGLVFFREEFKAQEYFQLWY